MGLMKCFYCMILLMIYGKLLRRIIHMLKNTLKLIEIKSILDDLQQRESNVTQYFNSLNKYWLYLDKYDNIQWTCLEYATKYKLIVEKKKSYKFLIGLNKNLDRAQGRILGTKPLPSIWEAFSKFRREESKMKIMLKIDFLNLETSTLTTQGNQQQNKQKKNDAFGVITAKKMGYTRDTCQEIHSKPANWKPAHERKNQGYTTSMEKTTSTSNQIFSAKNKWNC